DKASTLHVGAVTAGASVTITTKYMISTGVSDCFLTNAGVWTDTASSGAGKEEITEADQGLITSLLDRITPRTWKYREDVHGNDDGLQRIGIVGEELPDELKAPGPYKRGVSAGVMASFALAALK